MSMHLLSPLYLQRGADISMSHTSSLLPQREGRKNQGSLKNSYKLEQGNDQDVNGDTAMNTDRVQPQFKRSHLSVNIQPVSGITTREVGRSGGNCRPYSQHRSDSTARALTETSESEMAT